MTTVETIVTITIPEKGMTLKAFETEIRQALKKAGQRLVAQAYHANMPVPRSLSELKLWLPAFPTIRLPICWASPSRSRSTTEAFIAGFRKAAFRLSPKRPNCNRISSNTVLSHPGTLKNERLSWPKSMVPSCAFSGIVNGDGYLPRCAYP